MKVNKLKIEEGIDEGAEELQAVAKPKNKVTVKQKLAIVAITGAVIAVASAVDNFLSKRGSTSPSQFVRANVKLPQAPKIIMRSRKVHVSYPALEMRSKRKHPLRALFVRR